MLQVIKKEFSSNAEFCREMDLSHNWVNYYKKAEDPPAIHDYILSSLYELKNINPLWITNGVGRYKVYFYEKDIGTGKVTEPGEDPGREVNRALDLIEQIEQTPSELKDVPLPPDVELRLARLLTRLLERRHEKSED